MLYNNYISPKHLSCAPCADATVGLALFGHHASSDRTPGSGLPRAAGAHHRAFCGAFFWVLFQPFLNQRKKESPRFQGLWLGWNVFFVFLVLDLVPINLINVWKYDLWTFRVLVILGIFLQVEPVFTWTARWEPLVKLQPVWGNMMLSWTGHGTCLEWRPKANSEGFDSVLPSQRKNVTANCRNNSGWSLRKRGGEVPLAPGAHW